MACSHYGDPVPPFPRPVANRPALPHIAYRIGVYADFRRAILAAIDSALPLEAWTHREPDDPGIALLEGASILGDVLTFYQEHYANEAYLRTAQWRESVAELVRLLGYRLTPGLAGVTTFAFLIKGTEPVLIRAGFPVKAELEESTSAVDFEITADTTAYPHLSAFRLYRPRTYSSSVLAEKRPLELSTANGSAALDARQSVGLKKGDRILLMPDAAMWTSNTAWSAQQRQQIVTVSTVTEKLGRIVVEFDEEFHRSWTAPVRAFRINRTFRHFGHNAPTTYTVSKKNGSEITGALERNVYYIRHLNETGCVAHSIEQRGQYLGLSQNMLPLAEEVNNLTLGGWIVVESPVKISGQTARQDMLVARRIAAMSPATLSCGAINGGSTILTLATSIVSNPQITYSDMDIRDCRVHEVTSPELMFTNAASGSSGSFASPNSALFFYGLRSEAVALAGRRLILQHDNGKTAQLVCTNTEADFTDATEPKPWLLNFDRTPAFTRADFTEDAPRVTVLGNLADATQGKTEQDAVLGNGDNRAAFQMFRIPKAPVAYLLHAGATPPQQPELEIWVDSRLWTRRDSLFGAGPKDEIYILREDADNNTWVQFGDGQTGARLPSGLGNVTAKYRSGSGAYGPVRPDTSPSAGERLERLDKIRLPELVTGGTPPEAADSARIGGPGKVQSLGRLVSLRDYETELQALPGVVAVTAAWDLHNGVPSVMLRVLLEGGREGEFTAVRQQIETARACRGPGGYAVIVEQARLRYLYLDVQYAFEPNLLREDVEASLRAALGLVDDEAHLRGGIFGLYNRRIGEKEYATRIEGLLQQVPGIRWCRVVALRKFSLGINPETTPLPGSRALDAVLTCPVNQLLQLHPNHLTLTPVANPSTDACS